MASADMKAVITLTADASGVQSGVQSAMKSLNGMASQFQSLRGGPAGQMVEQLISYSREAFEKMSQRITDAAHQYSPAAMESANNLAVVQQQQDQRLANAFGDVVAMIDNLNAQALKDVTDYIIEHKDSIGKAMENMAILAVAIADVSAKLAVDFADSLNFIMDLIEHPVDTITSGKGVPDGVAWSINPVLGVLNLIVDKMGGD